jgi:hypothetical protein
MKTVTMCLCATLVGCVGAEGEAPPGADQDALATRAMAGVYDFNQTLRPDDHCQGVLPTVTELRLGVDGIAELESDGVHLARWRRTASGGLHLENVHAYAWWANADVDLAFDEVGNLTGRIFWWNASTGGQCTIATSVVRRAQ